MAKHLTGEPVVLEHKWSKLSSVRRFLSRKTAKFHGYVLDRVFHDVDPVDNISIRNIIDSAIEEDLYDCW